MSSRHANEFDGFLFADEESVARSVDWFRGQPIGDRWVSLRVYWQAPGFPVGPDTSSGTQSAAMGPPRDPSTTRETDSSSLGTRQRD
jgi:hypothetical protein